MSIRIMAQAWDVQIPASQKLVLLSLADQSNDDGVCWPSVRTTSVRTGLCERSTRSAITDLENAGHLTRNERPGRSTYYTIHPCSKCTPAANAPLQQMHPPLQQMHPTPASAAPITVNNHQVTPQSINHEATPAANAPPAVLVVRSGQTEIHRFSMFEDWDPSDSFGTRVLTSGISESWINYLDEFCSYWQGRPTTQETQAGWENKFLKNIKFQIANREARLA